MRALRPEEISIILAAAMLARLLSGPMVGMIADRAGALRLALAPWAALVAGPAAALLWAYSFTLLLS
jgi:PPP family 3-phenylpropionic acid transporter